MLVKRRYGVHCACCQSLKNLSLKNLGVGLPLLKGLEQLNPSIYSGLPLSPTQF